MDPIEAIKKGTDTVLMTDWVVVDKEVGLVVSDSSFPSLSSQLLFVSSVVDTIISSFG